MFLGEMTNIIPDTVDQKISSCMLQTQKLLLFEDWSKAAPQYIGSNEHLYVLYQGVFSTKYQQHCPSNICKYFFQVNK